MEGCKEVVSREEGNNDAVLPKEGVDNETEEKEVSLHRRKNRNNIFNKKARDKELHEELTKNYYCGTCSLGFDDLEVFRAHWNSDEEHIFHTERRKGTLVPGLGFCRACVCLIQVPASWDKHKTAAGRHDKSVESLRALGIEDDFSRPYGCDTPGVPDKLISHLEIDVKKSHSSGYRNYFSPSANHVIGLNMVIEGASEGMYFCKVCSKPFTFKSRISHLASVHHRRVYMEEHYSDYYQSVMKDLKDYHHLRKKFRLAFHAAKIEEKEKESETEASKELRRLFFDMEACMQLELESQNLSCKEKATLWREQLGGDMKNPRATDFRTPAPCPARGQDRGPARIDRDSQYRFDEQYNQPFDRMHDGPYPDPYASRSGNPPRYHDNPNQVKVISSDDPRAPFLDGRRDYEIRHGPFRPEGKEANKKRKRSNQRQNRNKKQRNPKQSDDENKDNPVHVENSEDGNAGKQEEAGEEGNEDPAAEEQDFVAEETTPVSEETTPA